eukprot:GFYU01004635.1.p1 GENE.GFYU01004635.1~~GFYU01004635.1.p1  ORF type:complete len:461 (+),score=81.43 GFYU01004635.1:71-1453(+)
MLTMFTLTRRLRHLPTGVSTLTPGAHWQPAQSTSRQANILATVACPSLITAPGLVTQRHYSQVSDGPLTGYRVIDLTRILAGPFCTMVFGDLGAEVIKIERPKVGDDTRRWGPPFLEGGESAYFLGINRNKKSVTVNFGTPEGQQILHDMVKDADVFIHNMIPGKLESMNLGYEQLKEVNPRLVYAGISGFGPDGPYANKPGYDVIASGMGGLMGITGEKDGGPVKVGVAITDITTGLLTHGAIMAALLARGKTGRGQKIDASLLEAQVAALVNIGHNYLLAGQEGFRTGTAHASIVPYQAFETSDGHVIVGAGNDAQFVGMCKAMGVPELSSNDKFKTNPDRVANQDELLGILKTMFKAQPTATWLDRLEGHGFPFGPINTMEQVFSDPQVLHRQMVQTIQHPTAGNLKLIGMPVKYSDTSPTLRLPPPLLGQHTREVLKEVVGYSDEHIAELEANGII